MIVDRISPDTRLYDNVYCTRQNATDLGKMATDLNTFVFDTSRLVFIATNGNPIPADWNFGTDGDKRITR